MLQHQSQSPDVNLESFLVSEDNTEGEFKSGVQKAASVRNLRFWCLGAPGLSSKKLLSYL